MTTSRIDATGARRRNPAVPWWGKIGAKIVLSRLPVDYSTWQSLGLFRHGYMDESSYIRETLAKHLNRAGLDESVAGATLLELGPGDSVGTAVVAASLGARCILVDAGNFAVEEVEVYRSLAEELAADGLHPPDLSAANSVTEVLSVCGAIYLTEGLRSLEEIPSASVDLVFSQAVLEHVRRYEFEETMRQMRRILTPTGVASHRVDLKDHLGAALNNLRFSERRWESTLFVDSGFYTNRIRFSEMCEVMTRAGFEVDVIQVDIWDELPTPLVKLDPRFSRMPKDELLVSGFDVVLRPVDAA